MLDEVWAFRKFQQAKHSSKVDISGIYFEKHACIIYVCQLPTNIHSSGLLLIVSLHIYACLSNRWTSMWITNYICGHVTDKYVQSQCSNPH